jgi:hypothetical protein
MFVLFAAAPAMVVQCTVHLIRSLLDVHGAAYVS